MIHYLDGGPLKAEQRGNYGYYCYVVAYDDDIKAFWCGYGGQNRLFIATAEELRPPPPIPAAARKPGIGEVWMVRTSEGKLAPRMVRVITNGTIYALKRNGDAEAWSNKKYVRPATPEEAEPFRPILEGLERSLGES